ncbi:MAG TPA: VWA domain-containing protein [Candidatus Nanoarchaeia archaeon]|nr:VWA domain-containing protein [Candidatus Nanoarchaeia archaeon]
MVVFSDQSTATDDILELSGKLGLTEIGQGLMRTVVDSSEQTNQGKLIKEAINQGFGSFVPDSIYQQFVQHYSYAEQLYGKTFVNLVSGYDADYVGKNVKVPEFQRELKKRIAENIEKLKEDGLIDQSHTITEKGMQLAALVLYVEELQEIASKNLGERIGKHKARYGSKGETHVFRKGDRYRDIALKSSIRRAVRRGHGKISTTDLETFERIEHGGISVIYGLDASGSMKGKKLDVAKKAGIALAFAAIERKDKVGLIVFSKDIKETVAPTSNFGILLQAIARVRAARETDIVLAVEKSVELFPSEKTTKHLLLLSDALPTVGKVPEEETLASIAAVRSRGITVSVVGINLDEKGEKLAQRIAEVGEGRFYLVRNIEELDKIVLEDYYQVVDR